MIPPPSSSSPSPARYPSARQATRRVTRSSAAGVKPAPTPTPTATEQEPALEPSAEAARPTPSLPNSLTLRSFASWLALAPRHSSAAGSASSHEAPEHDPVAASGLPEGWSDFRWSGREGSGAEQADPEPRKRRRAARASKIPLTVTTECTDSTLGQPTATSTVPTSEHKAAESTEANDDTTRGGCDRERGGSCDTVSVGRCDAAEPALAIPREPAGLPLVRLPQEFFRRDPVVLGPLLLGKLLRRGEVVLRITEVEAYCHTDTACHARFGRTKRTAPIFGRGGHAYVYLCYGLHQMLNVTAGEEGTGAACLVRACEPVSGHALVLERRNADTMKPAVLAGPGRVGAALGLSAEWSGHALYEEAGLELCDGPACEQYLVGPRVGIEYAHEKDRTALWRFAVAGSPWVSNPRKTLIAAPGLLDKE